MRSRPRKPVMPNFCNSASAARYMRRMLMTPKRENSSSRPAKRFCATVTPGMVLASCKTMEMPACWLSIMLWGLHGLPM